MKDSVLLLAISWSSWRWRRCRSFLLDLRFGLIGRLLLVLQSFFRRRIGLRGRYVRFHDAGIWRLWHTVCALLLRHFLHTVVELFVEVVLHFLQVIHFNGHGEPGCAVRVLACGDACVHHVVRIRSVGEPREYVTPRQPAFLPVCGYREIAVDDKRSPGRIQRRRNFVLTIGWSIDWSIGRSWRRLCGRSAILSCLCLLPGQPRFPFVANRLFDFRTQRYRRGRRRRSSFTFIACRRDGCVHVCVPPSLIRRLQLCGDHIIRQPVRWRSIIGIRREPSAIETPPRRSSPAPRSYAPVKRRAPGMITPGIKSRVEPETRMEAVVSMTVPVVGAINGGMVGTMVIVCARIVRMTTAADVGPLYVSATPSGVYHAHSIMFTHHRASAVEPMVNVYAAAIDRPNLSIGADARGPAAFQRNLSRSLRRVPGCRRVFAPK